MACPNGYIEVNGDCLYAFGNESGVGPDGTPLPSKKGGGFWDWVNQNLPDILIAAGSVWQSGKQNDQQPGTSGNLPTSPAPQNTMPVWGWILLVAAVLVMLILLLRGRTTQIVQTPLPIS